MMNFFLNGEPIERLSVIPIAGIGALQPLHGRYQLGHTKLAPSSAVLTSPAMGVIRTSKPSDVLTVETENGVRFRIVAWGWDLDRHTLLGYLAQ
jgi:hypothetical protein